MSGATQGVGEKKKLILNAFVESCSGHQSPGLWRHPDDQSADFNNIKHWVKLAQLLEKGGFHGMFIADVLVRPPSITISPHPSFLSRHFHTPAQWALTREQ